MPSSSLAATLVAHRKRLGLSQEELAEAAQLNLRTIQRLEKGETLPRGFTLQALAHALALPIETLTAAAEAAPLPPAPVPAALPAPLSNDVPPAPAPAAPSSRDNGWQLQPAVAQR